MGHLLFREHYHIPGGAGKKLRRKAEGMKAHGDFQLFRTVNILWVTYSARNGPWGTPDVFRSNSK